jgi:hypothetical protein
MPAWGAAAFAALAGLYARKDRRRQYAGFAEAGAHLDGTLVRSLTDLASLHTIAYMLPHRTTFSLDQTTVDGIRDLAKIWRTSQTGVVRRAIAEAVAQSTAPPGVEEALASYRAGAAPRTAAELTRITRQMRQDRRADEQARKDKTGGEQR